MLKINNLSRQNLPPPLRIKWSHPKPLMLLFRKSIESHYDCLVRRPKISEFQRHIGITCPSSVSALLLRNMCMFSFASRGFKAVSLPPHVKIVYSSSPQGVSSCEPLPGRHRLPDHGEVCSLRGLQETSFTSHAQTSWYANGLGHIFASQYIGC